MVRRVERAAQRGYLNSDRWGTLVTRPRLKRGQSSPVTHLVSNPHIPREPAWPVRPGLSGGCRLPVRSHSRPPLVESRNAGYSEITEGVGIISPWKKKGDATRSPWIGGAASSLQLSVFCLEGFRRRIHQWRRGVRGVAEAFWSSAGVMEGA